MSYLKARATRTRLLAPRLPVRLTANELRWPRMDDLDRLALEVAISIKQAETEAPGSQTPASIKLAQQILDQLQRAEPDLIATFAANAPHLM